MIRFFSERRAYFLLEALVILALLFSGYSAYKAMTLKPGEQATISGGTTVSKPSNNIADVSITDDGYLLLKYEDGTQRQAGYILQKGEKGDDGQCIGPTDAQVAAAVASYCTTNGRCDPKSPSAAQVALAVSEYCSTRGECQGPDGNDGNDGATGATGPAGQNATPEQIMSAVQQYCSDGRCRGPQGETGIAGANGKDPVMNCVIRQTNGLQTQYVAWKYSTEANSAYRDLYQLPVWAQGSDCVDLTGA